MSGITVRMVSRFRCPVDIVGITTNERSYRRLALSWGNWNIFMPFLLAETLNFQDYVDFI